MVAYNHLKPVSGDPILSSCFYMHYMNVVHTHTYRQNTHKIKTKKREREKENNVGEKDLGDTSLQKTGLWESNQGTLEEHSYS